MKLTLGESENWKVTAGGNPAAETATVSRARPYAVTFRPVVLAVGVFICYLTFCLLMPLSFPDTSDPSTGSFAGYVNYVVACLYFSPFQMVVFGLVLGVPLGLVLRRVRNQWLHVLAFFAAGAAVALLIAAALPDLGSRIWTPILISGLSPAVGRLSVWKLVTIRHRNEPGPPVAPTVQDNSVPGAG